VGIDPNDVGQRNRICVIGLRPAPHVVGVEGMAQHEGVGGHPRPDAGHLRADWVVVRCYEQDQRAEADHVHGGDDGPQGSDSQPFALIPGGGEAARAEPSEGVAGESNIGELGMVGPVPPG
jgi:hypothetical protein